MSVASVLPDTGTDLPFMQPVLRRGRSYLDRAVLPGDENESRLTGLLARLTEQRLNGVVLFGAAHLPENLVYYANYPPTTFHGVLIARTGEPPILLAGKGGARDHPYIRTVSWVSDIRYAADIGEAVAEATAGWNADTGRFGVAGLDTALPWAVRDGVVAAVGDRAVAVDDVVAAQRRVKTPRELAVLRRAGEVARIGAEASVRAVEAGGGRRTALAAADHAARAAGAHDCRITAGAPSGGLTTLAEVTDDPGPVSAVVAAEFLGYWGVATIDVGGAADPAGAADLSRVVAALRPDRTVAGCVAEAGSPGARYLVNGIGCGLTEAPTADSEVTLVAGDVVTVVRQSSGPHGLELGVRTVQITPEGGRDL
jgi:Xaa-Pro aminopeptidase